MTTIEKPQGGADDPFDQEHFVELIRKSSQDINPRRRRVIPVTDCWRMNRRYRESLARLLRNPMAGWVRAAVQLGQSKTRLILPPIELGGDPDKEWKDWGHRVSRALGGTRIPGSWHTARGRKKRKRWLIRNFGRY